MTIILRKAESVIVRVIEAFPEGSVWQTRYLCLPAAVALATWAFTVSPQPVLARVSWLLLGAISWTLMEYLIHRFAFHLKPWDKITTALLGRLHLRHHDSPADQSLVCVPLVLASLLWFLVYRILIHTGTTPDAAILLTSGVAVMATIYDLAHFFAHYGKAGDSRLLQWIKKNHMAHHFGDPGRRYGVTTPIWDYVFGTKGLQGEAKARE